MTGIIKDISYIKDSIFLKLINFDNFIDVYKVYINVKDQNDFEKLKSVLKKNQIVSIKNNIK